MAFVAYFGLTEQTWIFFSPDTNLLIPVAVLSLVFYAVAIRLAIRGRIIGKS